MADEEYWPLQKRVDELLHTLVALHKKVPGRHSPEFHAYKSTSLQFDWLEHTGIDTPKNRVSMQLEDVGTLAMRRLITVLSSQRNGKTFDLTLAGLEFHDEHCERGNH